MVRRTVGLCQDLLFFRSRPVKMKNGCPSVTDGGSSVSSFRGVNGFIRRRVHRILDGS